jgi:hypothetical protein
MMGNRAQRAATLHDYLYTQHLVSRRRADAIFEAAMIPLGISWWKRKLMWLGVRLFGASHYKKCSLKKSVKEN